MKIKFKVEWFSVIYACLITISVLTGLITEKSSSCTVLTVYNAYGWNKAKKEVKWHHRLPVVDSQGTY